MQRPRKLYTTNRFIWLHTPKTGGTWLHDVFSRLAPPSWEVNGGPAAHVLLHEVPVALEHWNRCPGRLGLPIMAAVRNPWDWYVSAYFFMEQHRINRTGGFAVARNAWEPGIEAWEQHYSRGNSVDGFRRALPLVLEALHGPRHGPQIMWPQHYFLRAPDGSVGVHLPVMFEQLRQGILERLEALGAEVTPELRTALLQSPKANASGHADYAHCYDAETRRLVERYDGWLIDRFEYRFGGVRGPA